MVGVLGSQDPQGATYDPMYELSLLAIAGRTGAARCTPISGTPSGNNVNPRGTYCHFDVTSNPDFAAGLQSALAAIAGQETGAPTGCPPSRPDWTPSGSPTRELIRAADSSCIGGQWFVWSTDAKGTPTELELCPDTCAAAQVDPSAALEVTFRCSLLN